MPLTSYCSLTAQGQSPRKTVGPLPRLFRSTAFLSLPPVSKTQPPNPESYFPTLRKEGMPTHRKASVAQSHPGRKPRWEAAGHLLVKEETISWAPWTRPTLGCISHQPAHYQPCCNCCANPTTGLALPPASHSLWLQRWLGEDRSLGWSLFLLSEIPGPLPVWSHLCAFIFLVQTETGPFSLPSCALGAS